MGRCVPGWAGCPGGMGRVCRLCRNPQGSPQLAQSPSAPCPRGAGSPAVLLYCNHLGGLRGGFPCSFYVTSAVFPLIKCDCTNSRDWGWSVKRAFYVFWTDPLNQIQPYPTFKGEEEEGGIQFSFKPPQSRTPCTEVTTQLPHRGMGITSTLQPPPGQGQQHLTLPSWHQGDFKT